MAYTSTRGDVGTGIDGIMRDWLPPRLTPGTPTTMDISDLSAPDAGYSGKTVFFTATWTDPQRRPRSEDLVLRLQAKDHQLFTTPNAPRQAEVMRRLGQYGIAVPHIVGVETDPSILGAPFYVMRRVYGRTPSDVPSWHKRGWTGELSASERELLCNNGLRALVAVHQVDAPADLEFLRANGPDGSTALQRYLLTLQDSYDWCRDDLKVGSDTLARALQVIHDQAPETDAETIVWGDARVGNMSFADDLSVAALFDWETASTGPADIDLGWWLMFETFLCESLGFTRPPGVPTDDEFVCRYQEFGGALTGDIIYYKLVAAFVLSLINNRLALLLVRDGLDVATARSYPQSAVDLVERYLREL